jgi:hypothetical protein
MKPVVFASNPSFWFETLRSLADQTDLFLEGQPEKLLEHLTCEKTFIMFTEEQAADAHVQVGAMRFTVARIGDWLDTTFA